jgi:hypothetical protein
MSNAAAAQLVQIVQRLQVMNDLVLLIRNDSPPK